MFLNFTDSTITMRGHFNDDFNHDVVNIYYKLLLLHLLIASIQQKHETKATHQRCVKLRCNQCDTHVCLKHNYVYGS